MPFKKSQKAQARLPFAPVSQSSPGPDGSSQLREQRQMAVLIHSPTPAKRRRVVGTPQSSYNSGLEHETYAQTPRSDQSFLPTPAPSSQTWPGSPTLKRNLKVEIMATSSKQSDKGESSVSEGIPHGQPHGSPSLDSDSGDDSDIMPTRSLRAAQNNGVLARLDEDRPNPRTLAGESKQRKGSIPPSLRRMRATKDDVHNLSTCETVPSTRTRNQTKRARLEHGEDSDELDELDQLKSPLTGKHEVPDRTGQPSRIASMCSDESSDDIVSKPPRRRLSARIVDDAILGNGRELAAAQHAADLQEDLEDLRDNHKELHSKRKRDKIITPLKNAKQKQLEKLRRRHANTSQRSLSSSSHNVRSSPASSNDGPPASGEVGTGDEALDSGMDHIRQSLLEDADEYEEDFVDDDNEGLLGAPAGLDQIPLEFTRHAHKEPIEHFKDVVEWMVHNKLNPAFARNDEIYRIAVRKLDDQVQAYAGSKSSTVWSPEFTNALRTRPEISTRAFKEKFDVCQACNRKHPTRYRITLSGKAYDRDTLEELTDEDDEDKDEFGEFPDEGQSFFVGSTCVANAGAAHTLNHWRIHLKSHVLHWLEHRGHLTNEKILERESWNIRKREKYANALVDKMEGTGAIRTFYNALKENQKAARATMAQGDYVH